MRLTRSVKCEETVSVNIGSSFQQVEDEEISQVLVEEAMVKAVLCYMSFFTMKR